MESWPEANSASLRLRSCLPANSAIDAESVGDQARISVVDQGPGIPDDRRHELFRKFARLGAQSPGTGLGLFISRGIARAHGGELSYEANPDGGARFTLALPLG